MQSIALSDFTFFYAAPPPVVNSVIMKDRKSPEFLPATTRKEAEEMKAIAGMILVAVWALVTGVAAQPGLALGASPDWVLVDENPVSSFSYDSSGITKPREGIIRVTTRVVYTEKGKAETLEILKPAQGYEKLYESRFVLDLDCKGWKNKLQRVTHLDKAGTQLKMFDLAEKTEWEDIPPDARIGVIAETECAR